MFTYLIMIHFCLAGNNNASNKGITNRYIALCKLRNLYGQRLYLT